MPMATARSPGPDLLIQVCKLFSATDYKLTPMQRVGVDNDRDLGREGEKKEKEREKKERERELAFRDKGRGS